MHPGLSTGQGLDCGSLGLILHWYNHRNKQAWDLFLDEHFVLSDTLSL